MLPKYSRLGPVSAVLCAVLIKYFLRSYCVFKPDLKSIYTSQKNTE